MLKPMATAAAAPTLSGLAFRNAHSHWVKPSRMHKQTASHHH